MTETKTTYDPMFLSDLTRSVEFKKSANLVPKTRSFEDLEQGATSEDEYGDGFTLADIKGWQKLACDSCMILWAEPPEPVRMSMPCRKCGGMAYNDGVF